MFWVLVLTTTVTFLVGLAVYFLDSREREPIGYLVRALLYGFMAAALELLVFRTALLKFFYGGNLLDFVWLLNDEIDNPSLQQAFWSAVVIGGFLKEGLKIYFFLRLAKHINHEIDEPIDCIVYAVMVSLGFQFFENLLFIQTSLATTVFYGFIGLVKHLACGIAMGALYARKIYPFRAVLSKQIFIYALVAWVVQSAIHGVLRFTFIYWSPIKVYFIGLPFLAAAIWIAYKMVIDTKDKSIKIL
jgi:protease PrsW